MDATSLKCLAEKLDEVGKALYGLRSLPGDAHEIVMAAAVELARLAERNAHADTHP